MDVRRYAFCGNRYYVLQKMFELNLDVRAIFAVAGSYLERELSVRKIPFVRVDNRKELLSGLRQLDFDIFISNGCPFILPVSELSFGTNRRFINIHPSLLPDLRGADPVPGAILYGKDSGATCHVMNDRIDEGDIISQSIIPMTSCLDSGLLYQLSFLAEQQVFLEAFGKNFQPIRSQGLESHHTYYTFQGKDLFIDFCASSRDIIRRVKAFNTRSKGARFIHKENLFKVFDAEMVTNPYARWCFSNNLENQLVSVYENTLLLKKIDGLLKLKQIEGDLSNIRPGDILV